MISDQASGPVTLPFIAGAGVEIAECRTFDFENVSIQTPCVCVSLNCSVTLNAPAGFVGSGKFLFRLKDIFGRFSNESTINVAVIDNIPPVLGPIGNPTVLADVTSDPVAIPLTDSDSPLSCSTNLTAVSANTTLLPTNGLVFSGTVPNCTLTINPGSGQVGAVTLQVQARDEKTTVTTSISVTVLPNPPTAPSSLTAIYAAGPSTALSWGASSGPGPITYTVYRTQTAGTLGSPVAACSGISVTSCSDDTIIDGTQYYYKVRATNLTGTSLVSNEFAILPKLPTAPTLSRSITIPSEVNFNWTAAAGSIPISYTLKRATSIGGTYTALPACSNLSTTTCKDTTGAPGTEYFYVVTAANAGGVADSSPVSATPIAAFTISSATAISGAAVDLIWPATAGATSYTVRYGTTLGSYPTIVSTNAISKFTVTGLNQGTTYHFQVQATNSGGLASSSNVASVTMPTPPSAPTLSRQITTASRIDLSWTVPSGTAPITYTVKRSITSGSGFSALPACTGLATTTCNDATVSPGTTYFYIVTAANLAGNTDSNEVSATAIASFAITSVSAQGTTATVDWEASAGATAYTLRYGTSTGSYPNVVSTNAISPANITGLTPNTTYYIMVVATNPAGAVNASAQRTITPVVAPTTPTATGAGSVVNVSWPSVASATSYNILRSTTSGSGYTPLASNILTNSYADTSAFPGITYYYVVQSVNANGVSANSPQASAQPLANFNIDSVTITPVTGARALLVNWSAVTGATNYTVRYSTTAGAAASGTTACASSILSTCTITNLDPGTIHYIMVTATNSIGGGASLNAASEVFGVPMAAFTIASATPTNATSLNLAWNASVGASAYTVKYGTATGDYTTIVSTNATSPQSISGLAPLGTHYFMVVATNTYGSINATAEAVATQPTPPSAPTLSRQITTASRIDLSWTVPSGTAPITYTVKRSTTSGSGFSPLPACTGLATTTCNDATVSPGTTYFYIVTAANLAGNTDSNEVSATALGVFDIVLTPGNKQIQATFSSPGATDYQVQYGTAPGVYATTINNATSPLNVTNLVNGTTHYFMVTASNSAGSITATAEASTTPNGPSAFSIVSATPGDGVIRVIWNPSANATSYTVRYGTSSGAYDTLHSNNATSPTTIGSLTNGTKYYVMVIANNAQGSVQADSEFSATPGFLTLTDFAPLTRLGAGSIRSENIGFTLGMSAPGNLSPAPTCTTASLSALSSNTAVIANEALSFSGTYPNCTLNINLPTGQSGSAVMTVSATYGLSVTTKTFNLELLPQPAAAFGLRRLLTSYSGPAIQVRRTLDSATQDIGFASAIQTRVQSIPNPTATGAVAGTPGTLPTGWLYNTDSGISLSVVGVGTALGQAYIDLRWFGTSTSAGQVEVTPSGFDVATSCVSASSGQNWLGSMGLQLIAGSMNGLDPWIRIEANDPVGTLLESSGSQTPTIDARLRRYASRSNSLPSFTECVNLVWGASFGSGENIDATIRYVLPNLEQDQDSNVMPMSTFGSNTVALADELDRDAMASFCSLDTCSVVQWYDQSGNAQSAEQANPAKQPLISINGAVITSYSKPALGFANSGESLVVPSVPAGWSALTGNVVATIDSDAPSWARVMSINSTSDASDADTVTSAAVVARAASGNGISAARNSNTLSYVATPAHPAPFVAFSIFDSTKHVLVVNGTTGAEISSTGSFGANLDFRLGLDVSSSAGLSGRISEAIIFPSAITAQQRQAFEAIQKDHFDIP